MGSVATALEDCVQIRLLIGAMTSALPTVARTVADEHHLSFLFPRGASAVEFENAVVLATPNEKGALVRLNTSLHFGVSHIDDLSTHDPPLGMSNSLTHMHNLLPLWLDLPLVEKVLEAGNISGPRALYSSKYTQD